VTPHPAVEPTGFPKSRSEPDRVFWEAVSTGGQIPLDPGKLGRLRKNHEPGLPHGKLIDCWRIGNLHFDLARRCALRPSLVDLTISATPENRIYPDLNIGSAARRSYMLDRDDEKLCPDI